MTGDYKWVETSTVLDTIRDLYVCIPKGDEKLHKYQITPFFTKFTCTDVWFFLV